MDQDQPPLTRADFLDQDSWFRYCRLGGVDPYADEELATCAPQGPGENAQLFGAIYGSTAESLQRTLAGGWSAHLNYAEFERAYRAVAFANCRGIVLDTFVTITWRMLGIKTDEAVDRCQARLLADLQRWCDDHRVRPAWVWVLEKGRRRGLHTHMLISIPGTLVGVFRPWLMTQLPRLTGADLITTKESRTVDIKPLHAEGVGAQWSVFRYLFKGLSPRLVRTDARTGVQVRVHEIAGLKLNNEGEMVAARCGVAGALEPISIAAWAATHPSLPPVNPAHANGPNDLYTDTYLRWHEAEFLAGRWRD
jgi:hypothetical protein